ncbi:MAG: PQQ-binding-like beta-propeller repeat protein [bacterium]|nr:PQQ-binding-like beta-propeller repeat protein [bacterium]
MLRAYKLGGEGDLTESNRLWTNTRSIPNVPSPLFYRGVLYTLKEGGILSSFDIKTGKILKQARVDGALGRYYASPIAADGKLYTVSEEGKVGVIRAGAEWEQITTNTMEDGTKSTPAIADGRIYLRTYSALYCFENAD